MPETEIDRPSTFSVSRESHRTGTFRADGYQTTLTRGDSNI